MGTPRRSAANAARFDRLSDWYLPGRFGLFFHYGQFTGGGGAAPGVNRWNGRATPQTDFNEDVPSPHHWWFHGEDEEIMPECAADRFFLLRTMLCSLGRLRTPPRDGPANGRSPALPHGRRSGFRKRSVGRRVRPRRRRREVGILSFAVGRKSGRLSSRKRWGKEAAGRRTGGLFAFSR